jgi:DnaT-like ssDNA binding protein
MSLIMEDGSGKANANAYADVTFADAYLVDVYNDAEWQAVADDDTKEAYLMRATAYIDTRYRWYGKPFTATQALGFPRSRLFTANRAVVAAGSMPIPLKVAVVQIAKLFSLGTFPEPLTGDRIKSMTIDGIALGFSDKKDDVFEQQVVAYGIHNALAAYGQLQLLAPKGGGAPIRADGN